jgi:hypothetical protein
MTALTEYYYGKEILLANTGGYRIPPIEPRDFGSFQWHHDEKGKVIKAMILLTDVGPSDQRMDYIVGTNKRLNPWVIYQDSRFTNEQANKMGKIAPCIGSAGTVILFDTNGIHRGNRNNSKVRDVWVHNYTSGNALYPSNPLHPGALKNLSNREKKILRLPE